MIAAGYQFVLDTYFAEQNLTTDDVDEIVLSSKVVPFPRKADCTCSKCTSPWTISAVESRSITLITPVDNYTAMLPGLDWTFEHT